MQCAQMLLFCASFPPFSCRDTVCFAYSWLFAHRPEMQQRTVSRSGSIREQGIFASRKPLLGLPPVLAFETWRNSDSRAFPPLGSSPNRLHVRKKTDCSRGTRYLSHDHVHMLLYTAERRHCELSSTALCPSWSAQMWLLAVSTSKTSTPSSTTTSRRTSRRTYTGLAARDGEMACVGVDHHIVGTACRLFWFERMTQWLYSKGKERNGKVSTKCSWCCSAVLYMFAGAELPPLLATNLLCCRELLFAMRLDCVSFPWVCCGCRDDTWIAACEHFNGFPLSVLGCDSIFVLRRDYCAVFRDEKELIRLF